MKKAKFGVAVLLAFAIVLGFAFETKADSPLTFSGLLRLRGFVLEGFPPFSPLAGAEDVGDGYFVTRFRLNVVFKPTDFLEVRWRLHAPGAARWGAGNWSAATMYAYGVVKTTAGTVSAGRVSSDIDSAGFQTLGYNPGWGFNAQAYVFDVDSERDGVMYRNTWDNGFGLKAFYVKRASELPPTKDGDYDRFSIEPYYKWDGGGVSFAVQYDRDQTGGVEQNYLISVNPSLVLSWATGENSSLSVNAEAKYSFGKYRATPGAVEQDQVGAGLYADLTYGYGTGNVSVAGWWFEGGSHDERSPAGAGAKLHGRVNGGEGFYPLMIYYYGNSFVQGSSDLAFGGFEQPNHWGIAL
ncbi:MAG: hypothetical protein LBF41_05105, partial [Deltaproteobacteria bacterium]|nr:hypothetical protein [Deltaproteobacteria bacterium]